MDDKKTRLSTDLDHDLKLGREIVELDESSLNVSRDGTPITEIKLADIKQARIEEGIGIARLVVETNDGTVRDVAFFHQEENSTVPRSYKYNQQPHGGERRSANPGRGRNAGPVQQGEYSPVAA